MKIAQISCVFPPYKGGIGMMAYHHAKSLIRLGHQVDVITPQYDEKEPQNEEKEGFKVRRLRPLVSFGNAGFCPQITQILSEYEVIHLHIPFFGLAEFVWLAKLKNPKMKLVVTYHMDVKGAFILRPYFWLYSKIIMPQIIKSADRVIVTSNDYAAHSQISKLFYSIPGKFVELPPEVETKKFNFENRKKYRSSLPSEIKNILFVGGMDKAHYFKGIPVLLKAFAVLINSTKILVKLILVGQGELQSKFKKITKDLNIENHVEFAGGISSEDLPTYYAKADAFVLPSIDSSEAFGIVSIEALASGTPIIVSRLPGVRTVVNEGVNGYTFSLGKEGELAAKINDVLNTTFDHQQIAIDAKAKYDTEVIGSRLESIYKSLS